jgi:hypothetical protein
MADRSDARGVLVIGNFGTGKTSVIEELAELLESRDIRYAAIDLDWLGWFDPGDGTDDHGVSPVLLRNVDAVVGNYYEIGIRRFALARAMQTPRELADLQRTLAMPLTTVRLTLPIQEIERRLATATTSGRATDLAVAREWAANGVGAEIGDLEVANDRPIGEVALEIFRTLAW